ncbi:MAG: hypothetical protein ACHWZW_10080 [Spirulina sp.]
MDSSNQKSKRTQINPALFQELNDEQSRTLEGGATIALSLIFITAELDRSSTKNKGAVGLGLGIGGG